MIGDPDRAGWGILAYTVWMGPWGGHESAPLQLPGGQLRAAPLHSAVAGRSRRTSTGRRCSRSAWAGLSLVRRGRRSTVVEGRPRYYRPGDGPQRTAGHERDDDLDLL